MNNQPTSHTLEITILSVENLSMNKKSKALFVSLHPDSSNDIYSTKEDSEGGGSCHSWNEKLLVQVPLGASFITAEVKCKASKWIKSSSVGMARIPVSDMVGHVHHDQVQFLSYRLWDSKVERNGVINISVREKVQEYAFPVMGMPVAGGGSDGVVTGIPAWSRENFEGFAKKRGRERESEQVFSFSRRRIIVEN